jgi:sigma-B regulation protein RsbU (phosphoserine phosphatase)
VPIDPSTVLVADRAAVARAWSSRVLGAAGHTVLAARDRAETMSLSRMHAPDVALVSDRVAGHAGCDVVADLRRESVSIGIVFLAHEDGADIAAEALRLGADDAIVRPCHEGTLSAAVDRAAVRSRARRARLLRDERLDGELRAAAAIQEALLPEEIAPPEGYRLDWAFLPAREVGGDLLDLIGLPGGGLAVMLADVSGKGLGAALLSGMARTGLRAAIARGDDPGGALAATGDLLMEDLERTGAFLTAAIVALDPPSGMLLHADAGHGHHLIVRAGGGAEPLRGGGPPLGLVAGASYSAGEEHLAPGDRLILFSDGLVGEGESLADAHARLVASLGQGHSASELVAAAPDVDDRTLLVLERDR